MKAVVCHDIGDIRLEMVRSGAFDPTAIITKREGMESAIDACKEFDLRRPGWLKVELIPSREGVPPATGTPA